MLSRALLILTLLGATQLAGCLATNTNETSHGETSMNRNQGFTLVSPKQVVQLERTIKLLLGRLATPIRQPVALRSDSPNDTALQRTISQISWSIRKKLLEFADACGLHRAAPEQFHSSGGDWFSEMLLQGSLVITDLGTVADQLSVSTKNYLRQHNVILPEAKASTLASNNVQFLGAVDDFSQYSVKLTKCLKLIADKDKQGFNLNNVLLDLLKASPGQFTRTLRKRLDKNLSSKSIGSRFNHTHMLICASVTSSGGEYSECIEQLTVVSECLYDNQYVPIKPAISLRTNDRQFIKSIKRLSNCKVDKKNKKEVSINCKSARKMPVNMKHRVKYIYERLLDQKLPKSSSLHRTASELGNALSKSELGTRFAGELWQYLAIYEEGKQKLNKLSKSSETDPKIRARYKKVSKALQVYKQGLLSRTINAIGKVHKSAYNFEKLLVKEIRSGLGERWLGHIGILTCLANWMITVIQLLFGKNSGSIFTAVTTTTSPPTATSADVIPLSEEQSDLINQSFDYSDAENQEQSVSRSKTAMTKLVDKSMKDLIRSMQHVSKYRSTNERSTLACLANNLLLVAMFMETIGFVSTLFCIGHDQQNQGNSEEMYNYWRNMQGRTPDITAVSLDYAAFGVELDRNKSIVNFEDDD